MSTANMVGDLDDIYQRLELIDGKIKEIEGSLNASSANEAKEKLQDLRISFGEVYSISRALMRDLRRMGLGEDADRVLSKITRIIMAINQLTRALTLLELGTPYGWVMGGLGLLNVALESKEILYNYQETSMV